MSKRVARYRDRCRIYNPVQSNAIQFDHQLATNNLPCSNVCMHGLVTYLMWDGDHKQYHPVKQEQSYTHTYIYIYSNQGSLYHM